MVRLDLWKIAKRKLLIGALGLVAGIKTSCQQPGCDPGLSARNLVPRPRAVPIASLCAFSPTY